MSDAARELKQIRNEAGFSVRELAKAIGWEPSTYATYEDRFKKPFIPMKLVNELIRVLTPRGIDSTRLLRLGGVVHENVIGKPRVRNITGPLHQNVTPGDGETHGNIRVMPASHGADDLRAQPPDVKLAQNVRLDLAAKGPEDIPVRGVVRGGQGGGFELNMADPLEYVRRPISLIGKGNVYALHIDGLSMAPRYEPGETILVWEQKPPLIGRDVVIQLHPRVEGDNPPAYLKRLVKRNSREVVLQQFNPPKTITVKTAEILTIHMVLTRDEML